MPSLEPTAQERGFRTALWGFDKNDVLAYMNALANESQQQELTYQEQISQLQAQIEKLKKEQSNARICVEKLQSDLAQATARADAAEKERDVLNSQLTAAVEKTESYVGRYQEARKSTAEAQLRARDLQKELDQLRTAQTEAPAAPAPVAPVPAPAPVAAPAPARTANVTEEARIEARKILADARLTAENAEQRIKTEAQEQKARMADNARDLAAGVLLLRDRLARVDETLNAASQDLENATAAIYDALDHTSDQIAALGGEMQTFGDATPQAATEKPAPEPAPDTAPTVLRPKVAAQQVNRRAKPARPQPEPPRRLRRTSRRPVSQELLDAINRLDNK